MTRTRDLRLMRPASYLLLHPTRLPDSSDWLGRAFGAAGYRTPVPGWLYASTGSNPFSAPLTRAPSHNSRGFSRPDFALFTQHLITGSGFPLSKLSLAAVNHQGYCAEQDSNLHNREPLTLASTNSATCAVARLSGLSPMGAPVTDF